MADEVTISKIQAAWEQLTTATKLYFEEESLVAVHGLAASAFQVLDDLSKGTPYEEYNLIKRTISPFSQSDQNKIMREFRKPQNFIKHADRDQEESLTLAASHTEVLLLCGTFLAGTVASQCWVESLKKDPPVLFVYQLWFCKEYPETIDPEFEAKDWGIVLEELPKHFPIIPCLSPDCSKKEFYEWGAVVWERATRKIEQWVSTADFNSFLEELKNTPEYAELVSSVALLLHNEREEKGCK